MIPLKDNIPTSRFPLVTIALISLNVLVYLYTDILGFGDIEFISRFGIIPHNIITAGKLTGSGPLMAGGSFLSSQFIHGGLFHLAGNMLFLWIFGNNIEDTMGPFKFIMFYLACGIIAGAAQIIPDPQSHIPMIGASGAVAGVMGAYLLEYPRAKVLTLIWILFFIRLIWLPAFFIILYWVALQIFFQFSSGGESSGVAYMAHIGGFAAGLVFFKLFLLFRGKKSTLWRGN
ncbi:MAG: rhomboid family intramembrane serine protease [candidate division Zixibacteria bacterium]